MSEYKEYIEERNLMDLLLEQGYLLKSVQENLSGAFVEFAKEEAHKDFKKIHVKTANGRKYFSNLICQGHVFKEGAK
ncbi:hypothetical protein [Falsibacillus pallidus]|uniref:Uncharacterized protein n=1 Tax=Falsibacillus pallidus TaxID=493781 RepID=A0A370GRB9_9BACI|nr:hypothetical protein [Falsibacillus pallidus]RDI45949.1 hypothetical protein DFR59_102586 [Falsibacillus pallidus]